MSKKTILIADNSLINRTYLSGILSDEYDCLEAVDGQKALDILRERGIDIAAMLLDLVMPVMDGYQVLEEMSKDPGLRQIPVVVVTAESETSVEARALDAGAMDFLTKPIEPEIARRRIKSVVNARELEELHIRNRLLEEMQYQADHDELTGIFSRSAFYRDTRAMLLANPDTDYILIRWDIEKFKLVNDLFGMKTGDQMLVAAAESLARHVSDLGTYGRFGSDNFLICVPAASLDVESFMDVIVNEIRSSFEDAGIAQSVVLATGVFRITDHDLAVGQMCDRAGMALQTVKGDYTRHVAYYDDKLGNRLLEDQDILDNMEAALANGEFEVNLQPVYSLSTGRPASAEALVRWRRPGKGLVSPGVFIPLFEENGFISKMDYNIWEQVCQIQHMRNEKGLTPIPISVNLSRKSVYDPNLVESIVGLLRRYEIEPRLFRNEVTESAYIDNATQLIKTVEDLQRYGFTVLMDDFGNGYSSFNTLKDIPVDILKIDMKFMEGFERGGRVGVILASVLRMTKWLGIPVIAEGVETLEQYEFLHSIGCDYTQGFYFARPMPYDEFEEHVAGLPKAAITSPARFHVDDVVAALGSGHLFDRVMDDILDAYAVYEFNASALETVRGSEGYFKLFGYDMDAFKRESSNVLHHIVHDDREYVVQACHEAIETGKPCNLAISCTVRGGEVCRLHLTLSCVGKSNDETALIFAAFHLIDNGCEGDLHASCPYASENVGKHVF
ncbi:MAG: EAL domain-containing protein [Atopobiaceae bacterium]|jgi:diguanylate cyclase (GGDEF)-like protein|nr:EAL domain-containing protein [Atopobiaceae bacterium]